MPCPKCGRVYCDHTLEQRGQTAAEVNADMTADAQGGWNRVEQINRERGIPTLPAVADMARRERESSK